MVDPSKLLKAFLQEFGRAPKSPDELALFGRYKAGAQKEVPVLADKVPSPSSGITRENIEQGYGYRPQVETRLPGAEIIKNPASAAAVRQGVSPLMKILLGLGGVGGLGYLINQLTDRDAASPPPDTGLFGDKSVTLGQRANIEGSDLKTAVTNRITKSNRFRPRALTPGEDELIRLAQLHGSIPPPTTDATSVSDDHFHVDPYGRRIS